MSNVVNIGGADLTTEPWAALVMYGNGRGGAQTAIANISLTTLMTIYQGLEDQVVHLEAQQAEAHGRSERSETYTDAPDSPLYDEVEDRAFIDNALANTWQLMNALRENFADLAPTPAFMLRNAGKAANVHMSLAERLEVIAALADRRDSCLESLSDREATSEARIAFAREVCTIDTLIGKLQAQR